MAAMAEMGPSKANDERQLFFLFFSFFAKEIQTHNDADQLVGVHWQ